LSLLGEIGRICVLAGALVFLLSFTATLVMIIAKFPHTTEARRARLALIFLSLLVMAMIGFDLHRRGVAAKIVADAEAEDRDTPSEATLQGDLIDGPDVVAAYFRQGYVWAQDHGVTASAKCPSENRAYRDGCRAYVAGQR
jgi:hypothetical protein